ncbi:hypothetical protein PsorP6_016141 [Peronosclerospora sorghi]|uniref:Uncharacterized protein n=1 Tax=Peronosclerospora sorghi TaxID=230839 RepID=A0ACC0VRX0_9STRA|nr:hypothetical protein PsorP6_016141 [Peronosclerospora sorghi]
MTVDGGRVLSIQSHVVHGYVGNKIAVFALQLLGLEVDPIHSVQFSNHTGYPRFTGRRLTGHELQELVDGMESNNLLNDTHTHLLTGYIGSLSLLEAILQVYERLVAAQTHPECLIYVCDPVMGDLGRLYVPFELVQFYRTKILPICDVLTPNQFECEQLAEMELRTVEDAMKACKKLHVIGPNVVVISSFQEAMPVTTHNELVVIGSKVRSESAETYCEQYEVRFPWIDRYFTGTGDLFAALLLAWLSRLPHNFKRVLETVVSTIQDVLSNTLQRGGSERELKLVQSSRDIAAPIVRFAATPLLVPIRYVLVDLYLLVGTNSRTDTMQDVPPRGTRIQRRELLDAFVRLVGVTNVSILSNYTISSTQALLEAPLPVMSRATFLDRPVDSRNCETLLVSTSAHDRDVATHALFHVVPSAACDETVTRFINAHNARCRLYDDEHAVGQDGTYGA